MMMMKLADSEGALSALRPPVSGRRPRFSARWSGRGRGAISARSTHSEADSDAAQHHAHDNLRCRGWTLMVAVLLFFAGSMYAIVVSKMMPTKEHWLLRAVAEDTYYCLLVPLLIPSTFFAVYLNWLGLKFFRHS
eukprot:TRINITY_DN76247_c0_g1_i1.p1 TRINITY_DN76247_c0_g1~~TRINITY_DN76247_c0_g1_i1.p1  ORF type:complete len:135 (+),score=35.27 TRINITY_DN76247_c0_g1_i1:66-470(+)